MISELLVILKLEDDIIINFNIGDEIFLIMFDNIGDFLEIEVFIDFDVLFSNFISLGIDFGLDFMVGEFGLELFLIGE